MVEGPVVIQRGENYYLRLRRGVGPEQGLSLYFPVDYKESGGAGYYYFTGVLSAPEMGNLKEYTISGFKGERAMAKAGKLFWLNPDGSTQKLATRKES